MSGRAMAIGGGIIVLLAVLFYFLAYKPLNDQQAALVTETDNLTSQATQLRNQVNQLQDIRDNELNIRADLNRLRALIPSGAPSQAALVHQFQLAADASGVVITSLSFGPPTIEEGAPSSGAEGLSLSTIQVTGVVEGGYFQVVDLFRRVEVELTRGVLLDTVAITEAEAGFPTLSTQFTGRVFALLPVVQAAPAPAPPPAEGEAAATPSPSPTPTGAPQ